jgi:sigma-B regulation protein RsbU (phosphoserine phosphatase)
MLRAMDYKELFRKIEQTLQSIRTTADVATDLASIVRRLVDEFRDDLGIVSGRVYARRGKYYELRHEYPQSGRHSGFRIPASYAPIQELIANGYVIHHVGDPGVDRRIEQALGVERFLAVGFGDRVDHVVAFTLDSPSDADDVVYTLNTIRHVVRLRLREQHFRDRIAETREIQLSLLPRSVPEFGEFDVWGKTVPAEEVGGDLYDYIQVSDRVLGVAVVDSAGHGLPAALQARDAIIGLRMGVEERMRITATIEKLNRVVGHSALASKFISVFYGELEQNGTFAYCNAGHPPPLVYCGGAFRELSTGGLILGPNPDARYARGYDVLLPGSVLVLYSDGVSEAMNENGDLFETDRLREVIATRSVSTSRGLGEAIFDRIEQFSAGTAQVDDQTVVVVRRGG